MYGTAQSLSSTAGWAWGLYSRDDHLSYLIEKSRLSVSFYISIFKTIFENEKQW